MKIREKVFATYWYFAAERQKIFFARLDSQASPYSEDPIFQQYKFCNTYRASDRVSQSLIRDVLYSRAHSPEDTLFRTVLFRLLNKPSTWGKLESAVGEISLKTFLPGRYAEVLERLREEGPIYGNAFILCATKAFGFDEKHKNHLALLEWMFQRSDTAQRILAAKSLRELFIELRSMPLFGDFMAYQVAIDLNYSDVFNFGENDFTIAGPGAKRGIVKCFEDTGRKDSAYVIQWMVDHQAEQFARYELDFQDLWGRPLHAIDCQGLFCETDKYSRVRFPELASNRVRIKTEFIPTKEKIEYFYPPKWGVEPA